MPGDNIADLKVIEDLGEWKASVEERFNTGAQRLSEAGYPEQQTTEFIEQWKGLRDHFTDQPALRAEISARLLDFTDGRQDFIRQEICTDLEAANSLNAQAGKDVVELPQYCGPSGPKM